MSHCILEVEVVTELVFQFNIDISWNNGRFLAFQIFCGLVCLIGCTCAFFSVLKIKIQVLKEYKEIKSLLDGHAYFSANQSLAWI